MFGVSSQNQANNEDHDDDDGSPKKAFKFPLPQPAASKDAPNNTSIKIPSNIENPKMKIWVPKEQGGANVNVVKKFGIRNQTAPALEVGFGQEEGGSSFRNSRSENVMPHRPKTSMFGEVMNFFRAKKIDVKPEPGHVVIEHGEAQKPPQIDETNKFTPGRRRMAAGLEQDCDLSKVAEDDDDDEVHQELFDDDETQNTLQLSIKKWKKKKTSERIMQLDSIAVDAQHQLLIDDTTKRAQTEVPIPLQLEVRKEAYEIVKKTRQIYSNILGSRNVLTKEAMKREREIAQTVFGQQE